MRGRLRHRHQGLLARRSTLRADAGCPLNPPLSMKPALFEVHGQGDLDAYNSVLLSLPNLTRKNAWSIHTVRHRKGFPPTRPGLRNPVRHNENETKERGLMVLKGLKLSHPSQTVSRPRRLPCARPQNSFKHPAGRANCLDRLTTASSAVRSSPKQLQTPRRTGELE